jgi:hypothetical protein
MNIFEIIAILIFITLGLLTFPFLTIGIICILGGFKVIGFIFLIVSFLIGIVNIT